jgi:hypothetical protein
MRTITGNSLLFLGTSFIAIFSQKGKSVSKLIVVTAFDVSTFLHSLYLEVLMHSHVTDLLLRLWNSVTQFASTVICLEGFITFCTLEQFDMKSSVIPFF